MAQNFYDFTLRVLLWLTVLSKVCDFHHYFMAIYSPFGLLNGHKDITAKLCVIRYHKAKILAFLKGTNHLASSPGNDTDYFCFGTFAFLSGSLLNLYSISVKGRFHLRCRDEKIILHTLYCHKTKSFGMSCENTYVEFFFLFALLAFVVLHGFEIFTSFSVFSTQSNS